MDAMVGQFFYVFAHEMGHAMFDVLGITLFGRRGQFHHLHNAAVRWSGRARPHNWGRLLLQLSIQGSQVTVPLAAFSDAHSAPAQRFYNLLCTALPTGPTPHDTGICE